MINNLILSRPEFLKLSLESKWFYYHICAFADDDGVYMAYDDVTTGKISPEAYNELIKSPFVAEIYEEYNILYVKDWERHNYIRPDRKRVSEYIEYLNIWKEKNLTEAKKASKNFTQNLCQKIDRIDIERDKDIDIDKDLDIESDTQNTEKIKNSKNSNCYGKFKNIPLTDEQFNKFKEENPTDYQRQIDIMSEAIEANGYTYNNYYAALLRWKRLELKNIRAGPQGDDFLNKDRYNIKGWNDG